MTANYDSYLVPRLADIAQSLKPYINTSDFSLHKIIFDTAFDQVVREVSIRFKTGEQEVRYRFYQQSNEGNRFTYAQINDWFDGKDFQWSLYDKCYQAHENGEVKFTSFGYHPKPQPPQMVKKDLEFLTVADIKEVLKKNGHSTAGKRDELVNRLWQFYPVNDTENLLTKRYQEKLAQFTKSNIKSKYEMLMSYILQRAYFLRRIALQSPFGYCTPKLDMANCQPDDSKLAKLIDGSGYDDIILFNKINKLSPLFPTDLAYINFEHRN